MQQVVVAAPDPSALELPPQVHNVTPSTNSEHFEIIWSNLTYRIEPKWYKKINFLQRYFPSHTFDTHSSANSTVSSIGISVETQTPGSDISGVSPQTRSVEDPIEIFSNLNGTIKSGQVTAVLGPSGKCAKRQVSEIRFQ